MDADVITIETSRSQMEPLEAFKSFRYPNAPAPAAFSSLGNSATMASVVNIKPATDEIGPGVYDIHSPRVPSREEMVALLKRASNRCRRNTSG